MEHCGCRGWTAYKFWTDGFKTVVSMATNGNQNLPLIYNENKIDSRFCELAGKWERRNSNLGHIGLYTLQLYAVEA